MNVNQTYRFIDKQEDFRIINIDGEIIHYIDLGHNRKYKPRAISKPELLEQLKSGRVERIADPVERIVTVDNLSEKAHQKAINDWLLVKELWDEHRDEFLDARRRMSLIKKYAQEKSCSVSTLQLLLSKFLKGGMCLEALIPNYGNCGRKESVPIEIETSSTQTEQTSANDFEDIFKEAYYGNYLKHFSRSIMEAYEQMIQKHYLKKEKKEYPSYYRFWRWIKKQDLETEIKKKYSEGEFEREHRILTSSTNSEVSGPGDCFEVDATILDCHIVSRSNRNKVIGRPVLYLIVDRYSRMIVGMNVGLDAPSWYGAIAAYENMVNDKVEYCRKFGVSISPDQWPVQKQVPRIVIGDRGEHISFNSSHLLESFGIEIDNTAPYRGDLKGNVERKFGMINPKIRSFIDGAVQKEYRKRGDQDPRDEAKLNLEEITRVCIYCVLAINSRQINDFPLSEDQIAFDVAPIPLELWNYGKEHYLDSLRDVETENFRIKLLPRQSRKINRKGISFENLVYTAPDSATANWLLNHLSEKKEFAYDPLDMQVIYIFEGEETIKLELSDTFKSFQGMSLEEIRAYNKLIKENREEHSTEQWQLRAELDNTLEEINASVPNPDNSVSKSERKKDIRKNRQEEKRDLRQQHYPNQDKPVQPSLQQDSLVDCHSIISQILSENETEI